MLDFVIVFIVVLSVFAVCMGAVLFGPWAWSQTSAFVKTTLALLCLVTGMIAVGVLTVDENATTQTTTEYDVWKVSCAYGTFVAAEGGVDYSADAVDGYAVIYIDNGTLVSEGVGEAWSVVNTHICDDLSLRMVVTVEQRFNLFGMGVYVEWTTYDIYIPDPRELGLTE